MGLFGALNIGKSGIMAHQAALGTVGQNITNASNEAYSRQRVEFATQPSQRFGNSYVGRGVYMSDVRRVFDQQVENRLRSAMSTLGSLTQQRAAFDQLEISVNALGDDVANGTFVSVGGQLDQFYAGLQNLAADPASHSNRAIFVARADALASTIRRLAGDVNNLRASLNETVGSTVRDVNELTREIAGLNDQIVRAEVGQALHGQANDLRDRRDYLVRQLSGLTNISVNEQQTGAIDIRVGGDFLVTGNDWFAVETSVSPDRGIGILQPEIAINGNPFTPREGKLGGALAARDEVIPGFMRDLDELARTLVQTFNEVHSTGRGADGLRSVSSNPFAAPFALNSQLPLSIQGTVQRGNAAGTFLVDAGLKNLPDGVGNAEFLQGTSVLFTSGANLGRTATVTAYDPTTGRVDFTPPLLAGITPGDTYEITGLDYPIENGSFRLNVRNDVTGITDVFDIQVDRTGMPAGGATDDTSLQDMVNDINAQLAAFYQGESPVAARITDDYRLVIESSDADVSFHFSDDTSGFLAAAGINTFFTGRDAMSIGVSAAMTGNPNLLATGLSSLSGDNANVQRMLSLFGERLFDGGTAGFQEFWRGVVGTMGVESKTAQELATNQEVIATAAQNARERISGVNVDEEAIDLIRYQRSFQAASRYLGVVDQMLQELMSIV
jgi:flagellar hook-associated protein 1 FlgK